MLFPLIVRCCVAFGLAMAVASPAGAAVAAPAAPPGRMAFTGFGPEQGLGTSTTWAMLQDQAGFMWVGSEDGLFRFDGSRFRAYGAHEGLPSHFVWSLHQSADSTLWVGTYKGLARLQGDHLETVPLNPGGAPPEVSALASGPQGRLWVASSIGLFCQGADGGFQPVPGWPGGAVTALWARPESGRVWAAAWTGSQARILAWEKGQWTAYPASPALAGARLDALAVDGGQRVWARSLKTLWQLSDQDGQFHPALPALGPAPQRGHLFVDRTGALWVTTLQGLVRLGKDGPQWLTVADGLPEVSLTTVSEDRQATLWVSGAGVYHVRGGGAWRSYPQNSGLPPGPIWSVFRDRDGQRFAGTDRGLFRNTGAGWSLVPGTAGMQVRTVVQGPDRSFYLAGSPEILRWEPGTGRITRFGPADGVLTGGRIFRLLMGPDGTLWVATDKGGLLRGTATRGGFRFLREPVPAGTAQEVFNDLCLDAGGRLWAAGDQGLLVLDGSRWRRFTRRDGLRDDHVTYLHGTGDGNVIVAYFEPLGLGVVRFDPAGFRLLRHLDATVATDQVVYLLGEDSRGYFWVGTGRGLDRISPRQEVEHFGHADGLVGEDTNSMAFMAEPDGDVWIGTSLGLARFVAAQDLGLPQAPDCLILGCKLSGRAVPVQSLEPLRMSSRGNSFEAEFAGLSFVKGGEVNYQTRLIGLEPEWHDSDTRGVRYPGLAPGSYRFEVRARVGRGDWGQSAALAFEVLPCWWQSWWFRILAGFGVLGLAGCAIWWWVQALHRRNQLLAEMVAERTRELAQANELLKNQSLTDPLTGLKNRRFLGVCMPEDVAQVNRVHRSSLRNGAARIGLNIDMIFIMVDLDHFKDVNDRYGHAAGDLVLQEVAQILRLATRDSDTIVRWGGEEFLVVARNACRQDAAILMARILAQVAEHPFVLSDGREIHCTCSLGFTFYPIVHSDPELLSWERLLDLADHCLYAAKRGGRNAWVGLYPGEACDPQLLRERIPAGIGELIRKHQLQVETSLAPEVVLEWDASC